MRFVVLAIFLGSAVAHAEIVGVYGQGQAGYSGEAAVGVRAGAQVTFFEAYFDRTEQLSGGSVTRVVGGVALSIPLVVARITGRAGVGWVSDQDGGLDGNEMFGPRSGFVARAGAALELPAGKALAVGLMLEQEYYSVRSGEDSGGNTMAALYLKLHLGL
jgi:hypothetical protein